MMDWKDIQAEIAAAAPVLGTLIGGPAGGAIGSIVASALGTASDPAAVQQALKTNPDAAVKLRQIEADQATELRKLMVAAENNRLTADTAAIGAVNATMQAEAKADHWPTYSWRPFIGFAFGLYILSLFVLPLFHAQPVMLTTDMVLAIGSILGIASYFRGKMQADPTVPADNRG
jgi:hypothetical protein